MAEDDLPKQSFQIPFSNDNPGETNFDVLIEEMPAEEKPAPEPIRSPLVDAPPTVIESNSIRRSVAAVLAGVLLLIGFLLFKNSVTVFQPSGGAGNSKFLTIEKLTDTGDVSGANISPDGKLLVYFTIEGNKNTVWLRQMATGKSIQIFTTTDELIHGLSFSDDGDYIVYSHQRRGEPANLSRFSILGGAPTRIVNNHHGGWSFSPDGNQIAFIRFEEAGSAIMIADSNGANERKIAGSERPRTIVDVAWSPDAKSIAYSAGNFHSSGKDFKVFELNLADKSEKPLADFAWSYVGNVMWLPEKNGLLVGARENSDAADQIWRIALPGGKAEQVTNSSDSLGLRGATADFSRIIGRQKFLNASLWIAPSENLSAVKPITKAQYDFAWTPDGKIVLPARDNVATDIWSLYVETGERTQLTVNDSIERRPAISPDGRFVVFVSSLGGAKNIWRIDRDGNNQIQLTRGEGETYPVFTPDGQSIVYNSLKDGSLWQIQIAGGETALISKEKSWRVAFSPDGGQFAYFGRSGARRKLLVKSFPECRLLKEFDIAVTNADAPRVVWTKDGKSLIFDNFDSLMVGNLWQQSLEGGEPQQITNFTSERITDFGFSPDGKHLAIVRGQSNDDAVLIKGFE